MLSLITVFTLFLGITFVSASPTRTLQHSRIFRRQDAPAPSPTPVEDGTLPFDFLYKGCWIDNEFGRILSHRVDDLTEPVTVETCVDTCARLGYYAAGQEFSSECWCGDKFLNDARLADSDNECNMPCAGNSTEACGSGNRLSVYSSLEEVPVIPVAKPEQDPAEGWSYQGCVIEQDPRVLPHSFFTGLSTTPELCISKCEDAGFVAAGLEFGSECYCGTLEQAATALPASEADCFSVCAGDEQFLCGGSNRITLYTKAAAK